MATIGVLSVFDHEQQDWSSYKARLEQWFIANDIEESSDKSSSKRRAVLLSSLSETTYRLVSDLGLPKDVGTLSYHEVTALLDGHFKTKKCGFAERHKFHSAIQKQGESLAEWSVRVRSLAKDCDFPTSSLEDMLRDRFVLGLRSRAERDKLFTEPVEGLTHQKALQIAESVRCAREGSRAGAASAVTSHLDMHKMRVAREDRGNAASSWAGSAWGESLLAFPKKWLSQQDDDDGQCPELPKLPIPSLHQTMESYLDFASVITTPQKLEHTKSLVKAFLNPEGLGPKLQSVLETRREEMDNWITQWWLEDMYLKIRLPLPINSSPGMVFPKKQFAKIEEVADLGALFIDDLLDYKEMLDRGELPLERATTREKGQPLCMEQFYRLLGVCRVPEYGKDRLELPRFNREEPVDSLEELVVVACRNSFYPIPVKAVDRGRLSPGEIQAQLLHVMVDAAGAPPAPRIGLLTSMERDQWARAREMLMRDENNRTNLELISRALCILSLDEAGGDRLDADDDTNAMLRAMHGAGVQYHSANRWFDKTVQLIISSDGTVGMCYEHSAAEGVAVIRLAERALARADVAPRPSPPPALLPAPQAMKWNITTEVEKIIALAGRSLDEAIQDLDFKMYTYRGYGREFMKSCKTSPDVYIQLALQYAYYKTYGHLVSTYESASLRRFRNGRVDNIRSAHSAALAWVTAMCAAETTPQGTDDDGQKKVSFNLYGEQRKLELFEEAARKQTTIMEANIFGQGIDNHLLGLREAARETFRELPELFTEPVYKQMMEFKLSTSQVATTTDGTFMGYGPVVPDGYGCSYNPKKDLVIFCISSFHSSSVTNTDAFKQSLGEALDSMKLMFQSKLGKT